MHVRIVVLNRFACGKSTCTGNRFVLTVWMLLLTATRKNTLLRTYHSLNQLNESVQCVLSFFL